MKRAFLPLVKSLFVAVIGVASIAHAQEAVKVDPARGEKIYSSGDAARNVTACVACHGAAGNSTIAQNPKLAAQHAPYLVKQMVDFQSPQRANSVMSPIAKAMSEQDIRDVAAYLEIQEKKPGAARNKDTIELGKQIYRGGIPEKNVPACAACHGPSGSGMPALYARLGGQHQDYTAQQLINFRARARNNSEQMVTIARRMTDDEIQAVADYIAGLR
ncbi:MAG TPA: c-type cytochrome [Noviherbaspirillum sp.]|nr:c-type cytochrome [Noviherbaspirillum sp.]